MFVGDGPGGPSQLLPRVPPGGLVLVADPRAQAAPPTYQCPPAVRDCTRVVGGWIDVPHSPYPNPGLSDHQ
jgi:hypothetical protein